MGFVDLGPWQLRPVLPGAQTPVSPVRGEAAGGRASGFTFKYRQFPEDPQRAGERQACGPGRWAQWCNPIWRGHRRPG